MGNSPSDKSSIKELNSLYTTLKMINEPRYGEGKVLESKQDKQEFFMKEVNMTEEEQFKKIQKKYEQRIANPHPNMINLLSKIIEETSLKRKTNFVAIFTKHISFLSISQTVQRIQSPSISFRMFVLKKMSFGLFQKDLLMLNQYLIKYQIIGTCQALVNEYFPSIGEASNTFCQTGYDCQAFGSDTFQQCFFLCLSCSRLYRQHERTLFISHFSQGTQVSYSLKDIQAIEMGSYSPKHNSYKSDVFSLGMTMLQASLLQPLDSIYRNKQEKDKLDVLQLQKLLDALEVDYSQDFVAYIREMLAIQEDQRPDFLQLNQQLQNFLIANQNIGQNQQNPPKIIENLMDSRLPNPDFNRFDFSKVDMNKQQEISRVEILNENYHNQSAQLLKADFPNQLDMILISCLGTKPSIPDENIGNQIGMPDEVEQWHTGTLKRQQDNIKDILGAEQIPIMPVTGVENNSINYKQTSYDYSNIKPLHHTNLDDSKNFDVQKDLERIRQSYQIDKDNDRINTFQQSYNMQTYNQTKLITTNQALTTTTTQQQQQYNYLFDKQLNMEQKMNQYYQDLSKDYQFNQPDLLQKQSFLNSGVKNIQQQEYVIETYSNGSKYEGEKLNGQRHGKGRFIYADGGVYDGQWYQNRMHGYGILYYASGNPAYDGQWVEDKFEGQGTLYNENPEMLYGEFDPYDFDQVSEYWTKYVGGFHDDNKEGQGVLYLSNNEKFEGFFIADLVSGPGKFFKVNGQVFQGHWWQNKFSG